MSVERKWTKAVYLTSSKKKTLPQSTHLACTPRENYALVHRNHAKLKWISNLASNDCLSILTVAWKQHFTFERTNQKWAQQACMQTSLSLGVGSECVWTPCRADLLLLLGRFGVRLAAVRRCGNSSSTVCAVRLLQSKPVFRCKNQNSKKNFRHLHGDLNLDEIKNALRLLSVNGETNLMNLIRL